MGPMVLFLLCPAAALPARADDYRESKRVEEELAALKAPHPWAGRYSGVIDSLYIAPSGRYCHATHSCFGTSSKCGKLRPEAGRLVSQSNHRWERYPLANPPYRRVSWGKRRYLISESEMLEFVNAVNAAVEPRYTATGRFGGGGEGFLRHGDEEVIITGQPDLPDQFRRLLLREPLAAPAVWVGSRTQTIERIERSESEKCETPVRFAVGADSGVFTGMRLEVQPHGLEGKAVIALVRPSSSEGTIRQYDCDRDEPIPAGTLFASRPSYLMNSRLAEDPLITEVRFSTTARFEPFLGGEPEELWLDDPLAGMAAAEFSAVEIADVSFIGPFHNALSLKDVEHRIRRTLLSLGGNAVIKPWGKAAEPGSAPGRAEVRRMKLLRLSYRGRPLDPDAVFKLPSSKIASPKGLRHDWAKAVASARAAACGLAEARRRAKKKAALELLGWDDVLLRRAHELRFEDLDPAHRQAAERLVPPGRRAGYVWPALFADKDGFELSLWQAGWTAEREFRNAHPGEAAECERLEKEADLAYFGR